MTEKELQTVEQALSLVSPEVVEDVLSNYVDSWGLVMEPVCENALDILSDAYDLQVAEEDIDFEYFYDVLTTLIECSLSDSF